VTSGQWVRAEFGYSLNYAHSYIKDWRISINYRSCLISKILDTEEGLGKQMIIERSNWQILFWPSEPLSAANNTTIFWVLQKILQVNRAQWIYEGRSASGRGNERNLDVYL